MAMTTYLQMVTAEEIQKLQAEPKTINQLDQPDDQTVFTQLQQSLCFFLCGDAYPNPESHGPMAGGLAGYENVETSTLENGSFDVVPPAKSKDVAEAFLKVDKDAFRQRIKNADLEELVEEEELYDLEPWIVDGEEISALIMKELASLAAFYESAAERGLGVVLYTT